MSEDSQPDPLILTLAFDPALQRRLDAMRTRYFPPERNYLDAHLTLFHALPGAHLGDILADLRTEAARQTTSRATVTGLFSFGGGGFAYSIEVPGLTAFHQRLQTIWHPLLSKQDSRELRPHITIQNKVSKETADQALAEVRANFAPFGGQAVGVTLWHYRGGPWEGIATLPFA